MKFALFITVLLFVSCKKPEEQNQGSGRTDAYGEMENTWGNPTRHTSGDFTRTLDDLMSGPTRSRNCSGVPRGDVNPESESLFTLGRRSGTPKSIKGEEQVYWNECEGTMKSNYAERKNGKLNHYACTKRRKVSKEYFNFFEQKFPVCVTEAFASIQTNGESKKIDKISFTHEGVAGDSSHSNRSFHSVNRAMDVALFKVTSGKKTYVIDVKKGKDGLEKIFLNKFRKCWNDSIISYNPKCSNTGNNGTIGHEDKHHQNHMHVSLPYCDGRGGYYSKIASTDGDI